MGKDQVKLLKWFVDFVYIDLEKIEIGEMAKLYAEIHFFLVEGPWGSYSPLSRSLVMWNLLGGRDYESNEHPSTHTTSDGEKWTDDFVRPSELKTVYEYQSLIRETFETMR